MKLILTRHGETEENKSNICQGQLPGNLSHKGKQQAELVAERLKDIKIDFIYTSDLRRCVQTAKVIAKHHPEAGYEEDKALREKNCGTFQGKKHDENDWSSLPGTLITNKPPGGETYEEVWKRVEKFYKKILKKHINDTVLIVGHGGSIMLLLGIIQNKTIEETVEIPSMGNTAVSEFEIDSKGKCKVVCINCNKHL